MNKRGFTLMELLVYMAIVGIVVIVAGQAFSDSTKMRIRTQSMIKASQDAENVGSVFKEDLAQMGAKSSKEQTIGGGDDVFSTILTEVYMDPDNETEDLRDSSSFVLTTAEDGNQDLKLRRARYDESGKYMSVEEVRWFVEDNTLKRSCWTVMKKSGLDLDENDPCVKTSADEAIAVAMAENVSSFLVKAAKPSVSVAEEQVFPRSGDKFMLIPRYGEPSYNSLNVVNNGEFSVLSGFASNFDQIKNEVVVENVAQIARNQLFVAEYESAASMDASSWKSYCSMEGNHFTFEPLTTYEIFFSIPIPLAADKMDLFKPEQDHWSVGFRTAEGVRPVELRDFLFYPPVQHSNATKTRSMRFSVGQKVENVCLAFTFASLSPVASEGSLTIDKLVLRKVATANYSFEESWNTESNTNIKEKKNVKAFRVEFSVKKNGNEGTIEQTILVPSNGPRG